MRELKKQKKRKRKEIKFQVCGDPSQNSVNNRYNQ